MSGTGAVAAPLGHRLQRGAVTGAFLFLLASAGLGAAGHGPASALAPPSDSALAWVGEQMGLRDGGSAVTPPVDQPQPAKHKHKHKHKKK